MFRKICAALTAASLFFTTNSMAGGVVPDGMGMYRDGRTVNTIPASSNVIHWYAYGSALTVLDRDTITLAMAITDYETQEFSLRWFDDTNDIDVADTKVYFSGKGGDVSPECLDSTPGGCVYAETSCRVKTKQGKYDLCTEFRTNLYMPNIEYGANVRGITRSQMLKAIVRHETGHVLGLAHFDPGPMTSNGDGEPFSPCQHLLWQLFYIDPAQTTWTYPPKPVICQ